MFCLVFVVTKNFEVNHLQGFSVNRVPFGQYDIITYTTFLSLRSHPETTVNILYDRANIDGVALNEMQKRMPVNASELEMFAQDQVKDLFRVIFERAANRAGEPAQLDDLELMSSFLFSRWPNAQVGDDFVYGLNARANNEPIFSPMFTDGVPKPPGWPY